MELKKIWTSSTGGNPLSYLLTLLGGALGIGIVAALIILLYVVDTRRRYSVSDPMAGVAQTRRVYNRYVPVLPAQIYFPCLGAGFVDLVVLVFCIVRQRRGE